MRPSIALIALAAASALTAGCAAPTYVSPVSVTRFTGSVPTELGHGTISLAAAPGNDPASLDNATFREAVGEELAKLGYTVTDGAASYVALVDVHTATQQPDRRGSGPVSVGMGGSTGSYGSGVGLGIGINLSGKPHPRIETNLSVSIRPADGGDALWEGRARFTASDNSDYANAKDAARRMAEALFRDFPGQSGKTVEVQ